MDADPPRGLLARVEASWLGPAPLTRLAVFRILILGLLALDLHASAPRAFLHAASVDAGGPAPWNPIFLFELLGIEPLGTDAAWMLYRVGLLSCLLGALGLFSRASTLVAFLVSLFWTAYVYSQGKAHHDKVALTFALSALPLAPSGARLSLDAWLARVRRVRRGADPFEVTVLGDFAALPLQLTRWTAALGYFFAGASKLYLSGLDWTNGYSLMAIMMHHDNTWSAALSRSPELCRWMSLAVLLFQVSFPLALFSVRARWLYLPAAVGFHLGTWQTMDTGPYMTLWFTLIAFLPLERIPAWWGGRFWARLPVVVIPMALVLYVVSLYVPLLAAALALFLLTWVLLARLPRARLSVVFDGACGLCRRAAATLDGLDFARVLDFHDLRNWEATSAAFPQLDREACIRDMHTVSRRGEARAGYAAYQALAWRLPLTLPFAWILYLPPVAAVGRRVYRRVADRREIVGCGDGTCPVHHEEI